MLCPLLLLLLLMVVVTDAGWRQTAVAVQAGARLLQLIVRSLVDSSLMEHSTADRRAGQRPRQQLEDLSECVYLSRIVR